MEFTSADIFQQSPFGNILNLLMSLSLSGGSWPNYVRQDWDADDEEIRGPPTTHLVGIVDDLTNMLDFYSEDIDGMDDDAGDEEEPLPTGHWTATSSYDIYMVDTPKEGNGDGHRRMTPPRSNPSTNVSGATLSPAKAKVVIPAQEIITLRIVPKTTTIPSSKI